MHLYNGRHARDHRKRSAVVDAYVEILHLNTVRHRRAQIPA